MLAGDNNWFCSKNGYQLLLVVWHVTDELKISSAESDESNK